MISMRRAREDLRRCEWDRKLAYFTKTLTKNLNEGITDIMSTGYRKNGVSRRLTDKFDDLVADVESRISILENMIAEQRDPKPAAQRSAKRDDVSGLKINAFFGHFQCSSRSDGSAQNGSSTTNGSSTSTLPPIDQIDQDLKLLEERIQHIEQQFHEDVEAEQIGIPFQVDDLIDYSTKMRKVMYKRIFLIRNYQALIRNDRRFKERAKDLTRSVVQWTDEDKKNVLAALTKLEGSLDAQRRSLVVINQRFDKFYPLENDLNIVQALIGRFLDRYQSPDDRSKRDENFIASLITSPRHSAFNLFFLKCSKAIG
ncbi:unnamed protein product [Toxocara canis]|uniref:Uncharacterized protein n=1 Tax=Toxocara canis TaxID=6265 RepID=A0A183V0J1_TOXCA|nr:unnamed protein product [Toxocara canis]